MTPPRPLKIAREIAIWLVPAPPVKGVAVAKIEPNPDQHPRISRRCCDHGFRYLPRGMVPVPRLVALLEPVAVLSAAVEFSETK